MLIFIPCFQAARELEKQLSFIAFLRERRLPNKHQPQNTPLAEKLIKILSKLGKVLFQIQFCILFCQDVCHLWELGGGTLYTNLIETPLSANKLPETTIVIVIDLSKPERIWNTLTTLISSIKVGLNLKKDVLQPIVPFQRHLQ